MRVLQPVVDELARRGTPFHGVLYAGLMLTDDGPKVLEFNVRFGDPETQAVLPRLKSDLLDLLQRATTPGRAGGRDARVGRARGGDRRARVARLSGVVVERRRDQRARRTRTPRSRTRARRERDGAIVTAGGRVLNVTALGADREAARRAAYAAADVITFDGKTYRRDIAA